MTKIYLIDEEQITLAHLLAHTSPEVRRHAKGALAALKKNAERILREQDRRMANGCTLNHDHAAHPLDCVFHN